MREPDLGPLDGQQKLPDRGVMDVAVAPLGARIGAFVAILLGGLCGGLIGFALVDIQTTGHPQVALGVGVLVGAVVFGGGVAVVAVLVLRAMHEWRTIQHQGPRRTARTVR